jgi:ketosteroid isomerase-like protein
MMSCALTELLPELEAWCLSYVTAFSAYDAEAIAAHWTFPAVIAQSGRSLAFKSAEHFTKNTNALLGFYKRHHVDRAVRHVAEILPMNDETVAMTVSDKMLDPDGAEIVAWQAAYVLQRIKGDWKAVMALADGEVAAWAARGTPLGG